MCLTFYIAVDCVQLNANVEFSMTQEEQANDVVWGESPSSKIVSSFTTSVSPISRTNAPARWIRVQYDAPTIIVTLVLLLGSVIQVVVPGKIEK